MSGAAFEQVRLENYADAADVSHRIVKFDGKLWYVKPLDDQRVVGRELLAPLLGADVVNVAATRRVSDHSQLLCIDGSSRIPERPYEVMCRLAQDYRREELPITDLDLAVAYELVFSLWIRRRDTHAGNRDFVGGVPIFFDHGVAFDGEEGYEDVGRFFDPTEDAGHAGRWRLRTLPPGARLDVRALREEQRETQLAIHYVYDVERARSALADAAGRIESITDQQISSAIDGAGLAHDHAAHVARLLLTTRSTLRPDIDRLQQVLALPPDS